MKSDLLSTLGGFHTHDIPTANQVRHVGYGGSSPIVLTVVVPIPLERRADDSKTVRSDSTTISICTSIRLNLETSEI